MFTRVVIETNTRASTFYQSDEMPCIMTSKTNKGIGPLVRLGFCEIKCGNLILIASGTDLTEEHYGIFITIVYFEDVPFIAYTCPLEILRKEYRHVGFTTVTISKESDNILRLVPISRFLKRNYTCEINATHLMILT